jgi:8-oxo-dGTP diphosphatase
MARDVRRTDFDAEHKANFRLCDDGFVPPFAAVTSVSVVPLLSLDEVVCVRLKRGIDIPGGHVQEGETSFAEVARRESYEEATIQIEDPSIVMTIESDYYGTKPQDLSYLLTVAARVQRLEQFVPSEESSERLILSPLRFLELYTFEPALMRIALRRAVVALFGSNAVGL